MADTEVPRREVADEPSFLEKQRAARPWFDHLVRAGERFQAQQGDSHAGGITYFSILSLIPILMVAFAVAGFVLVGRPELLDSIQEQITNSIPGSLGETINNVIESAIDSRASVGLIGLLIASYAGLRWISNVRNALTAMWENQRESKGFVRTKLGDIRALLSLGVALTISLGMSAVSSGSVAPQVVKWLGIEDGAVVGVVLRILSTLLSLVLTWAVFLWVIARLPREPVTLRSAAKAAAIAAVVFEIFKQVGAAYLSIVSGGPAGVAFGPIIGLLVFVFTTSRMLLFCTAWAATSKGSLELAHVPPPDPAIISPRVVVSDRSPSRAAALVVTGVLAGLGFSGLLRRRPR
ncbi:inner membrane protein YhjD [Rhodococcus marinonascens]|uniref:inner membrane protein YhjD n=1 Tax=Rhodococcus marinonascens TaxID=38311 RepID=UPI000933EA20|nr:inner membrane protein YhjD [Rhodococcus marinonascens]